MENTDLCASSCERASEVTSANPGASLLLHSLANFREIILPALELCGAKRIVEIGSEYGTFTEDLATYATHVNGHFTSIDPAPKAKALAFVASNEGNPHFEFLQTTSIEALKKLPAADAYIVDGDHNYYTVRKELELIHKMCGGRPVLIFQHDVCWPWGQRDLYYSPDNIPRDFCQPHSTEGGITLDNPGTITGGFRGNGAYAHALREGGSENGVCTAIEDFLAENSGYRFEIVPAVFGLGIIYSAHAPWAKRMAAHLEPSTANPLLARLERNRLELYLKVIELQDALNAGTAPSVKVSTQPAPAQAPLLFNRTADGTAALPAPSAPAPGPQAKVNVVVSSFIEASVKKIIDGLQQEHDVPELWRRICRLSKEQCGDISAHCEELAIAPSCEAKRKTALTMIASLSGYHAGLRSISDLHSCAETLVLADSQSPLVTGFHFNARKLMDPKNPIHQLENFVCQVPFQRLDILGSSCHLCCASWLHKSVGDMNQQSHQDVWNSNDAERIRQSVLDGSYRYCNKNACPSIFGGGLSRKEDLMKDPWWADVIQNRKGRIDRYPKNVNLAYDRQCNLSCPSCRTDVITTSDAQREKLDRMTQANIFPLLAKASDVFVTGSGDPFASRTFRKLLSWINNETCPDLKVTLMTNGMLFTPAEWAKFPNLQRKISIAKVSMDGASQQTHELLRRGSKWNVMMENLPFIGSLVKQGHMGEFEMVFVVQRENYREMGTFVDLAKRVGATKVYFERITNWGTFSPEQYQAKAVFNTGHPEHSEFLEVMRDPRLLDPMIYAPSFDCFLPGK